MRSRVVAAAASACLLAGSGCDYWKNMTGSKSLDRAALLSLTVRDAWTKEPVRATCVDSALDFQETTDAKSGLIRREAAPTGRYSLRCFTDGDPSYFDGSARLDLGPGDSASSVIELARRPGELTWYPGEPGRQVEIWAPDGVLGRVPEKVALQASPSDPDKTMFSYEWYRDSTLVSRTNSASLVLSLGAADTGTKVFSVKVTATPPGHNRYLVGASSNPIEFQRNRKPVFTLDYPEDHVFRAACDEKEMHLIYTAVDSDGVCRSIRFSTLDATSAMGKLDTTLACIGPPGGLLTIPLFNVTRNLPVAPHPDRFKVSVLDDNGETSDSILKFSTIGNLETRITRIERTPKDRIYTTTDLVVTVAAHDSDSQLTSLLLDWGDGNQYTFDPAKDSTFTHRYKTAGGPYKINATFTDNCGASVSRALDRLDVYDNFNPVINIISLPDAFPAVRFNVELLDQDLELRTDSLTLAVDWGDASPWKFSPCHAASP
jgi:hypothetical protein